MELHLPWKKSANNTHSRNSPFLSLQNEINKMFSDFVDDSQISTLLPSGNGNLIPIVDIIENDKSFKVEAELPGVEQKDMEVDISNNHLTIRGQKNIYKDDKTEDYLCRERDYGCYKRVIALPDTVDANNANATFKKGVLWVEIPKKPGTLPKSKKLPIKNVA
jgi:HSP20 family protein